MIPNRRSSSFRRHPAWPQPIRTTRPDHLRQATLKLPCITPVAKDRDPVDRREFLTVAASVAFVPSPTVSPYQDPDYVQALASRLESSKEQLGGVPLISTALRYVRRVEAVINSRDVALQRAASDLVRSASLVLYDARKLKLAEKVGNVSLTLARRAHYVEGTAHSYENLCFFTTSVDPVRAAHYAQRGLQVAELTEEHHARLNARLAVALSKKSPHAHRGSRLSQSAIDLARGFDALPQVTGAVITGNAALALAGLRRHQDADAAFTECLHLFEGFPLSRATWATQQVKASFSAMALPEAADQISSLVRIAPLVDSARLDSRLREILAISAPWSKVPEIQRAREQLRSVLPFPTSGAT